MSFLAFAGIVPSPSLHVGQPAPELVTQDDSGQPLRLADYYARGLTLIYFYPKAGTPGCTVQACSLRDSFAGLQARGLQILGVSGDKPEAQLKFRNRDQLPFPLIADCDGRVAKAFGVPTLLGHPKRQSFLIKDSRVAWRDLKVSPKTHIVEVNRALDALT